MREDDRFGVILIHAVIKEKDLDGVVRFLKFVVYFILFYLTTHFEDV